MAENDTTQELTRFPVSLPGDGQLKTYEVSADMLVVFDFDVAEAIFSSNGNDLVITVEGKGTIVFEDYLLLAQNDNLPTFELLDGEQITGDVYLFAFNELEEDVETAAGAGAGGAGAGAYIDDHGDLYRSLDSLQGQEDPSEDADQQSARFGTQEFANTDSTAAVNTAPKINGELNLDMNEDGTIVIRDTQILALVTDEPGSFVAVTSLTVSGGTLTQIAAGTWAFTPDQDFNGSLDVTFSVSDREFTVNGTGSIDVAAVNDAPVATDDTGAVVEDFTISGTLADHASDVDNEAGELTYSIVGDTPAGFVLTDANGSYTFDASSYDHLSEGETEDVTLTYQVTDPDGASHTAELTITISGSDDPIVISAADTDPDTINEDTPFISGQLTATDADAADNPDFDVQDIPGKYGTLHINENGSWTYTTNELAQGLDADNPGTESFTVTARNGDSLTDTETYEINLSVTGSEDPILITGDIQATVSEDYVPTTVTGTLIATDADTADTPDFDVQDLPGEYGTLHINADGTWTYTPDERAQALDGSETEPIVENFTVTARNGDSTTEIQTQNIQVTVLGQNDAPELTFSSDFINNGSFEDAEISSTGYAQGHTPEGWNLVSGSHWEVIGGERGSIGASDGNNVLDLAIGRSAPEISQEITHLEPGEYVLSVDMFDRGGQHPSDGSPSGDITIKWNGVIVATFNPDSVDWETGTVTVTVNEGETSGTLSFSSTDTDHYGNVIDNISLRPAAGTEQAVINENAENGSYVATAVGSDVDSTGLTYSIDENSPFAIDPNTGVITIKDNTSLDFETNPTITLDVTVTDGNTPVTKPLTIHLRDINEAPTGDDVTFRPLSEDGEGVHPGTLIFTEEALLNMSNAADEEGNPLSIENLTLADGRGTLVEGTDANGNPQWTFTPEDNYNGEVSFNFDISDGVNTTSLTANVNVEAVNDGPVLEFSATQSANLIQDGSFESVDIDQYDWADGYSPADWTSESGTHFEVMDGQRHGLEGASDGENVLDMAVGRTPMVVSQEVPVSEGQYVISLDMFDRGENYAGDGTDSGVLDILWNGEVVATYNPGSDDWDTGSILITVGADDPSTGTLTIVSHDGDHYGNVIDNITMHAVDTPADNTVTIDENSAGGTFIASAVGSDVDSTDLEYSISEGSPFVIDKDTGVIRLADDASLDYEASTEYTITVTVSDGDGATTTKDLTIKVGDVNEGPSLSFDEGTSVNVAENTAAGTVIATAAGTDPDAGDTLTYSVADDSPFAIDSATGEISIKDASVFDFEGDSIPTSVEVTVTDADGLSTSQTLDINVTNVNEGPSLSFDEGTSVNVAENTAAGTVIATAAGTDPDAGDTLTYSVADDSPFAIDSATGEISIKDASVFDFEGDSIPTSVEVTVTDADGLSTSQTLNINVTDVNEGPSLSFNEGTSVNVAENTAAGTVIATAAGTDPDAGDTLTYSVADDSPFAIDSATGEISIKDASVFDFEGDSIPTSVEVTVTDADGLSTSQTLNINVTDVNEGPSLSFNEGTSVNVAENTAAGTVIATAAGTDPDAGDTLTYSVADDSPFAIDPNTGEISIKDASVFDFEGDSIPTSVEVTVTDADGLSTSQTLDINVTNVNEGPSLSFDEGTSVNVAENTAAGTVIATAAGTDPDAGDTLTYSVADDSPFAIDPNTGEISIKDASVFDFEGDSIPTSVEVTVTDADGLSTSQTLDINVTNVNEGPSLSFDEGTSVNVAENTAAGTVIATAAGTDPDAGDTLTYSVADDSPFAIDSATGEISIKDASVFDFEGDSIPTSVEVTVTDADGLSTSQTLGINVTNVNEGPSLSFDEGTSVNVAENTAAGTVIATAAGTDPDAGDTLTYSVADDSPFAIDSATGEISIKDASVFDFEGDSIPTSVEVTVTDADGLSTSQTLNINVTDVNEGPSLSFNEGTSVNVAENTAAGTVIATAAGTDPDAGDTLTYSVADDSPFAIDPNTGEISIKDASVFDFEGDSIPTSVEVTVTDADGLSTSQTLDINVTNVNEGPSLSFDEGTSVNVAENTAAGTVIATAAGTDPDAGDTLTYSVADDSPFAIDSATGEISIKDASVFDFEGDSIPTSVEVTVTDADGLSTSQTLDINVTNVNEGPSLSFDEGTSVNVAENTAAGTVIATAAGTDPDAGDTLTYSVADDSPFAIDSATGEISIKDASVFDFEGDSIPTSVEVTVTDADGLSTSQTLDINVTNVNEGPSLSFDEGTSVNVAENTAAGTVIATAAGTDPDAGDTLTYSVADDSPFAIDPNTGEISIKDASVFDFEGDSIPTSVEVTVTDADGLSTSQTLDINVTNVNEGPSLSFDEGTSVNVAENTAAGTVIATAAGTDPDAGDTLTYSVADDSPFAIDSATGEISIKDASVFDFEGDSIPTSVEVTVTDADGLSTSQTLGINVTNVNEGPSLSFDEGTSVNVAENTAAGTVIATAAGTDPDAGDTLTYSVADDSPFAIDSATGEISIKDASVFDFEGDSIPTSVEVTVTDADGLSTSQTLNINVTDVNEGPSLSFNEGTSVNVAENTAAGTVIATAAGTDPDAGDTLTYSVADDSPFAIDPNTGEISIKDASVFDFEGDSIPTSVEVTVTDADGLSTSQTLDINVTNVNEGPSLSFDEGTSVNVAENTAAGTVIATAAGTDPDAGDTLTYSVADDSPFAIDSATGEISIKDASVFDFEGDSIPTSVEVTVTDADGLSTSQTLDINVTNVNEGPSLSFDEGTSVNVAENTAAGTVIATAAGTDPDAGDTLTYSVADDSPFAIDSATGEISIKDASVFDFEGDSIPTSVEVTVTDADGLSTSQTLDINVTNVNEGPSLSFDEGTSVNVAENTAAGTVIATAAGTDPDAGDTLTYSVADDSPFAIDSATGEISIKDASVFDFEGDSIPTSVEVTVTDADGLSTSQTLDINVTNVNEGPSLSFDEGTSVNVAENTAAGTVIATAAGTDPDAGDTLTYSVADDSPFAIDPNTGEISIKDASVFDFEGDSIPTSVEVTVTDADGLSTSQTLDINVTNVNEGPSLSFDEGTSVNVAENTAAGTVIATAAGTDPDAGDTLTYSVADDSPFAIDSATGEISIKDASVFDFEGDSIPTSVEVTVTDADGLSTSQTLDINVTNVNEGPSLSFDEGTSVNVAENTAAGTVIATAAGTDPDAGDTLTYSVADDSPFAIDPNTGEISIKDASVFDFEGDSIPTSVEVTVTDADGLSTSQTLDINVTNVNEGPSLSFDEGTSVNVAENTAAGTVIATAAGTDPDAGDTLTYSVADDSPFAIDSATGEISIKDASVFDFEGDSIPTSVEVTVTDADGLSTSQTLGINVTNVNEGPSLSFDEGTSVNVAENTAAGTVIATAAGTDPDAGDTLTYSVADDSPFAIDSATGEISIKDASVFDFEGDSIPTSVEVTVTDADGLSTSQTLDINVTNVNEGPSLSFDEGTSVNVAENTAAGTVIATAAGTDPDAGDTLTYSVADDSPFAIDSATGEISIKDASVFDFEGDSIPTSVEVTVTDADGLSTSQTLDINVTNVNEGPSLSFDEGTSVNVAENTAAGTVIATAAGTDPDAGDTLTYSVADDSPFAIDSATGEISIKDASVFDFEGDSIPTSVEVTVTDADGLSTSQTLDINVTNVNEGPSLSFDEGTSVNVAENTAAGTVIATAAGTDPDAGDTLTYSVADDSPFAIDSATGEISIKDASVFDFEGDSIPTSVEVTVTDADGLSTSQTLDINVTNVNEGPVAVDDVFGTTTVVDGETIDVTTPDSGVNVTTVVNEWAGNGVNVSAHTGNGLDPDTWEDANIGTKNVSFNEGGQHYAYSGIAASASGQIDGGETDTLDGSETTDTEIMSVSFDKPMETVTLELSALFDGLEESPNDGVDNRGPYDSGYVEMARVAVYDTDGVLLGYVDVSGTNNGLATVTIDAADYGLPIGSVAVMPLDDGAGDSGNNSDFLLRSVSGEAVDEVTGTYLEDQPIELTANDLLTHANAQGETDSDVDGDTLSVTSVGNATHGTVSMDDDGNITFEPEDGFSGAATFEYTISDGHGGTDTATVTLNITPVNDAPVIDLNDTGQHLDINAADSDSWGYNLVGMYVTDDAGNPVATEVLYHHTDVNGPEGFAIGELLTHVEDGQTPHFFFLNSGNARNSVELTGEEGHTFREDTSITFTQGADGQWYGTGIDETGNPLTFKAFFDDNSLNPDNHNRFTYSVTDENGTRTLSIEEYNGHAIDRDDMRLTITPQEDDSSGYTTSFTEGGSAVSIVGNMTITDTDSPDMSKAVITLTGAQAGDVLDTSGVSGLFVDTDITESGDIVVTLSGKATLAEYQNAIKAITFDNTSNDPVEGTRTITVQVTDAAGNESDVSNSATSSITVTALNEAPTSDAVTISVDEDGSVTVTQAMLLANAQDADGDTMTATDLTVTGADGTTYALTDNGNGTWTFEPGDNIESDFSFSFNIDDGNGGVTPVNGTFDVQPLSDAPTSDAVTINVTEDGSVTVTQAMLLATAQDADGDAMTARNLTVTGADGTTYALTDNGNGTWTFEPGDNVESDFSFTFDIEDGTGESTPVSGTFDVQPVNDAPVIDGSGATATYEDGDGALAILNGMSISDVDSDNLSEATITLNGTEAGDILDTSGVSGLFVDTDTNAFGDIVITLSGTASVAKYENAIKSITFSNNSGDLDDGTRTVSVQVTDAEGTDSKPSTVATATIDVEGGTDPGIVNYDVHGQAVTFHSEKADYQNMLGIYTIVNGKPSDPEIILTNSNDESMLKEVIHTFAEDAEVHFFFLPNVAGKTFDTDGNLHFIADGDGYLLASGNDHLDAKFDMPQFNHAGEEYGFKFSGNAEAGFTAEHRETVTVGMDDQFVPGFKTPGDDDDFNDLVVKVQQTDDGLFEGGSGNDYAVGGKGDDTLIGGRGNDTLYGDDWYGQRQGNDHLDGGKGDDLMYGGRGDDQMDGGEGHDIMYGESGHDLINGGSGEDLIYGQSGNDTIDAGDNDDLVYAGSGNDLLNGGAGDDILYGQSGDNLLVGGAGDDTMYGGSDDDLFIAGDGADVIYTGAGNDTIFIDQSVLGEGHNTIEVRDFHVGKDVLEFGDNVVKEINIDDQNGMSLVVGNDENSNDDVVVKLLGVTPTQLENHGSIHDTDTTADDLIQHMIDSAHNGHNN